VKTAEQIAAGLSHAQREALIGCTPWDVEVGAGIAIAFICNGLLEDSTICDDGVQLNKTGLAVRAILKEQADAK
jgi:hypothetical protein